MPLPIVLASRSPRRVELLKLIVPPDRILVRPPPSSEEASFDGLNSLPAIMARVLSIAEHKFNQTIEMLQREQQPFAAVIAGDTTVVVQGKDARPIVLGQPPAGPDQDALVRQWFREYYADREHQVLTGVCLAVQHGPQVARKSFVVTSTVRFMPDVEPWLDWYLSTGEPAGKAGGYALQGAGSLFVDQISGSLSNVIGLPIREVKAALGELGLDVSNGN